MSMSDKVIYSVPDGRVGDDLGRRAGQRSSSALRPASGSSDVGAEVRPIGGQDDDKIRSGSVPHELEDVEAGAFLRSRAVVLHRKSPAIIGRLEEDSEPRDKL